MLANAQQKKLAIDRNKWELGKRYIEVFAAQTEDLGTLQRKEDFVVKLLGIPPSFLKVFSLTIPIIDDLFLRFATKASIPPLPPNHTQT